MVLGLIKGPSDAEGKVVVQFETPLRIVIPKRGMVARGICCFAAGSKQVPRR